MRVPQFLRDWSLPIAMAGGAAAYFIYKALPLPEGSGNLVSSLISVIQPALIFAMLFVTFCKVRLKELKPQKWHLGLLAFQIVPFVLLSLVLAIFIGIPTGTRVILESVMMCLLCPTATAAAVITAKLGGNSASLVSYTIQINIAVAVVAPLFLAFSHPVEGMSLGGSFLVIIGKVFPLLLLPLFCASLVRRFTPGVHGWLVTKGRNLPFYLWLVALALAIAVTTKAIMHAHISLLVMVGIAAVSLICCLLQFYAGRRIGAYYNETVTGGQALGQKNTVFAIWFAYTFLTPVTAIAGGFYSVWHNIVNTWQLYNNRQSSNNR